MRWPEGAPPQATDAYVFSELETTHSPFLPCAAHIDDVRPDTAEMNLTILSIAILAAPAWVLFFDLSIAELGKAGMVVGTAILLTSWIIEKYQTDHWSKAMAEIDGTRAAMYREMILAQTDAVFLQSRPPTVVHDIEDTKEAVEAFQAFQEVSELLGKFLPEEQQHELSVHNESVGRLTAVYRQELTETSERELPTDEKEIVNSLAKINNLFLTLMENMLATDTFFTAGMRRVQSMSRMASVLPNKKHHQDQFGKILEDMSTFRQQSQDSKPATVNPSVISNTLYQLTEKLIADLEEYSDEVIRSRSRSSNVYKLLYIAGSFTLLLALAERAA